jgi:hypothetical protein
MREYIEKKLLGIAGLVLGAKRYTSTNIRTAIHGHYHQFDERQLEIARGEMKSGLGLIIENEDLFNKGTALIIRGMN